MFFNVIFYNNNIDCVYKCVIAFRVIPDFNIFTSKILNSGMMYQGQFPTYPKFDRNISTSFFVKGYKYLNFSSFLASGDLSFADKFGPKS